MAPVLRIIKSAVNTFLAPIGLKISRVDDHDWSDVANFIPFDQTIDGAQKARLSVGDYVDSVVNRAPGSSQATIDQMAKLGVFSGHLHTIVEIGAGTGRYLEKTVKAGRPERYEVYETAGPWASYLAANYDVVLQPTDGLRLSSTADASADMVQAHKVFSTVPFIVTCCYWHEMTRVIKAEGWAVFDVLTEACLNGDAMQRWAKSGIRNGSYPAVMPRDTALNFFRKRGFTLVGSSIVPMAPGTTELLVFRRMS
jgi:hypothetical protein